MAQTKITGDMIADDAVTTAKIADDAVTTDKLANSINSAITANTAKVTNAITTHTGDVTGAAALTIATNAVNITKLAVTDGSAGQVLSTDGSGTLSFITSGGLYNAWLVKTSAYTALSGDQIVVNSGSAVTITLPASPSVGDTVILKNVGAGLVTIARNGSNIEGSAQDGTLASTSAMQTVFVSSSLGWKEI